MIVYREFSSLAGDLGFSARTLYGVSYHRASHYQTVRIPKANGEYRELHVPDALLKSIQRRILSVILDREAISPYATAYRYGGGIAKNAAPHVGKPVVLKLDIRHFFDRVIYPLVKDRAFPADRFSESNRVLLTMLCMYRDALPQGAPTSPAVSNIIMREFDDTVGAWCARQQIAYTRYCDDMTFSGDFDPKPVIQKVRQELQKMGFFLNDKKTVVVRDGQKKLVTGVVVNQRLRAPAEYRRNLRQELYYCRRFGVSRHLEHRALQQTEGQYLRGLLGRVQFALQLDPDDRQLRDDRAWLLSRISDCT